MSRQHLHACKDVQIKPQVYGFLRDALLTLKPRQNSVGFFAFDHHYNIDPRSSFSNAN